MHQHLILGCGFLGKRLAASLLKDPNTSVATITRSENKAQTLATLGLKVVIGSFTDPASVSQLAALGPFDAVTICVTNDSAEQSHLDIYLTAVHVASQLVRPADPNNGPPSGGIVHLVSTTGVYAEAIEEGTWIDEHWPTAPQRPGSRASLEAERTLERNLPGRYCVFRLAGIYHPDRMPNLRRLQNQEPISGRGEGWLNLIHADDAAELLAWAAHHPPSVRLMNVADGQPIRRQQFYQALADHWGLPSPRFDNSGDVQRGGNKRIKIDRLRSWYDRPFRDPCDPGKPPEVR